MNSNQNPLDHPSIEADEARVEYFDQNLPYWEQASNPERFVSESDLPVYDASADTGRVPNEDWERMGG